MDYFRAVFHKREISYRSYDLTTEVIKINPGNYSAWYFFHLNEYIGILEDY